MEAAMTAAPVTTRFSQVPRDGFRDEIEKLSTAEEQWKNLAIAQVEDGTLTTNQGVAIISAVTASFFGYSEHHRQLTPADLVLLTNGVEDSQTRFSS